jgi:methionyl-tRNA formyltransferase
VVFFGTPDFAVPTFDALCRSRHPVVGVVTQPDRPRGRGLETTPSPVKARATSAGVPVLQPTRLNDPPFVAALQALRADIGVVVAYGRILPPAVLDAPARGHLNVHASLLPRYRGAAPVSRAIIDGAAETGVTIMRVVQALDAGPILAAGRRPIRHDETSEEVERDLANLGAGLLVATLDQVAAGLATEQPQDETGATYAPRLTKEDGRIDWTWSAARIHNLVRGLHPWPLAFTYVDNRRLIVRRSEPSPESADAQPGTILEAVGDRLVVAAGSGRLRILEIQPEGKRPMGVRDFLAGHPIATGERFASQQ